MEEQLRILVLCGGQFAFGSLQSLAFEKFICGVGVGKGSKNVILSVEHQCNTIGLPFYSFDTKQSMSEMKQWIEDINPDYIFSISFPFLIPEEVLAFGKDKFINFHPGPLPKYRGPMPIFEVLRYQEEETAVTVHFMSDGFDEGDIIFSETIPIAEDDTFGTLTKKMSSRTAQIALNMANMLQFASKIPRTSQDENQACYFEFPEAEDTFIHWHKMPVDEIDALVRACNAWNTGADAIIGQEQVKIIKSTIVNEPHSLAPGTVTSNENEELLVACMDNFMLSVDIIRCESGITNGKDYMKNSFFFESLVKTP